MKLLGVPRLRRRDRMVRGAAVALGLGSLLAARPARAQVHWDLGASAGPMKRVLTGGTGSAGFGPVVQVEGHVALLPLVRTGLYVAHDISPTDGPAPSRQITAAGLHVLAISPWPSLPWRLWLFSGIGYARVYAPSYHQALQVSSTGLPPFHPEDASIGGSGGGFVEVPIGIGAAYRLRRPWEITAALGARIGFGFTGSVYEGRAAVVPNTNDLQIAPLGDDRVGLFLTLGVRADL